MMRVWRRHPWLFWGLLLPVALVAGALLVAYSGVINIGASAGHPVWLEKFLALGLRRSVAFQSRSLIPPPLGPEALPLGAAHFHGNCAICHGAPGQPVNPTFVHMLPHPPPLQEEAEQWRTRELYWIGQHGLQFTGMPKWSGDGRVDEMWTVAALLRELPAMDVTAYRRYAAGNTRLEVPTAEDLVRRGMNIFPINTCDRCHGTAAAPAVSPLVPRLGGQSAAYLLRALQEYRGDRRQSGFMEPVAVALEATQLEQLARYYAALAEPAVQPAGEPSATVAAAIGKSPEGSPTAGETQGAADRGDLDRRNLGRRLAERGDPDRRVPACLSCHGATGRADFPRLAGQHAPYLEQQLRLWRAGGRAQSAYGAIMARVAGRLTDDQIQAVASYFARLEQPGGLHAPVAPLEKSRESP